MYDSGVVERARREASETLASLIENIYHKPVRITDPTPKGAHYKNK